MSHDRSAAALPLSLSAAEAALATQLLDALASHVALLDRAGRIAMVNEPWRRFAASDVVGAPASGVGDHYVELCESATGICAPEAHRLAAGIRKVLDGGTEPFHLDYHCRASATPRWFRMCAAAFRVGDWRGALITHLDITDLILSERTARDSEARYRAIFDGNTLPMWVYEPSSLRVLAVNDAAAAHYGYSRDEFIGMTLADFRPEEDVSALADYLANLRDTSDRTQVWRHRRKDGRIMRMEVRGQWMPWGDERARLVMALDVTERLAAAEALAESEQRFRELTSSIRDVFWLSEPDKGRLLYISPAYEKIWGRSAADLYQDPWQWFQSIHPDDRERVENALELLASGGYNVEYRILRDDGSIRWIADCGFPVFDDSGQLRRVAGLARDITDRQVDQERLRLLETAIDRLNDIVVITEAEPFRAPGPKILFVNDAFERRTGYSREEVIGKTPRILQGPATQRSELDRIGAALERWEPVRAELINYTKSGEPFWLELEIVPIANETGWFTHWVAVERDITERKTVDERLRQSQHLESLGQLTGGVAHDFNNLLTVILGNAELLTERLASQPPLRKLAVQIEQAAGRSAELTQRLLAFARKQVLEPRPVDLNRLLIGMDALLQRSLGEQIEIDLVCGENLWTTLIDPGQLENAVLNLAINARDAMPAGGQLRIETANVELGDAQAARFGDLRPGPHVLLTVRDNGVGIPAEDLRRVFQPFFTTKGPGKGTGLGLAMVYGFVKQSRGHIVIDSEIGRGTWLDIYLPMLSEEEAAEGPALREAAAVGGGERVLLVEDAPMVRAYVRAQLQELGYAVIEAADGPLALAVLQQRGDIDLLFTDIVMPGGMSGRDLADAARRLKPGLPVLYTSGYPADVFGKYGLDAGVLLLAKPYRRHELARKLSQALAAGERSNRAEVVP